MDQIEERLAEEVRKYDHLYNWSLTEYKNTQMACNSWKDISANVGLQVDEALTCQLSLRTPPRPSERSHAATPPHPVNSPLQGRGQWRREWPSPSDFFLYVAVGTKSLDTPALHCL
ncbi:unnamed protein product [Pleuronectes platessa]|uniref:MADF domain-containing protein n=1 Tax=Pleuronectes platessa TaxID=8262 RepID=A0A9N7Y719_PLEPL|nr:unnamed protein product [Pleuronectes platessa]